MKKTGTILITAAVATVICVAGHAQSPRGKPQTKAPAELTLRIADYAAMPITGSPDGTGNNAGALARINFLREEPAPGRRLFVNDLNGPLYILDRNTRKAAVYLDLNGRGTRSGLFDKFGTEGGLATGFISFEFDPDYAANGRFYTIHLEEAAAPGVVGPDKTSVPGLDLEQYTPTQPIPTPGGGDHEGVLIEWTDSNAPDVTFQGTARELLRVQLFSRIHPMGDLAFNPVARRGDADWRVLYVACGDGGAGDQRAGVHLNPQRLDTVVGKILRIVPDLAEHTATSAVSENGRYRIPGDNPFAGTSGARGEIWAYGLRNPHRLSWNVEPARSSNPDLIAAVIGWRTWETVVIVRRGANYGWPRREGNQMSHVDRLERVPDADTIPVQVTDQTTMGAVTPTYPVIQYGHGQNGGDAIAGGFVYRGAAAPELRGKYIFGDISTGRLWYTDFKEMLAADDGKPGTMAEMHELRIWWDDPGDSPDRGKVLYSTMAPIAQAGYHRRGGHDPDLPGSAAVSGQGRVDLRLAVDRSGELYLLTKSDGMIRIVTGG